MRVSEVFRSSIASLQASKMRTGLTMLGIVIGISSVILISSIGQGAVAYITEELSVFGTNYFQVAPGQNPFASVAGTANPITMDDVEALRDADIANVSSIAPFAFASSTISGNDEKTTAYVYGLTTEAQEMLKPDMVFGRFIEETDNSNRAKVVVLGVDISDELFGEGANPVGELVRIENTRFRVVGMTKASGSFTAGFFNSAVNIPLSTLATYITGSDDLLEIDISVVDEDLIDQTIEDVETFLRDYRDIEPEEEADFYSQSFKDSLATVQTITGLLTVMVAAISGISLVVGGVGVMNIMLVTVTERTKEIGLLKAIGARDDEIMVQFLVESVALSSFGGVIGLLLGLSGALLVSVAANIPFVVSPVSVVMAIGISSLVGVVFGLYPARRAARLDPIDALRYE